MSALRSMVRLPVLAAAALLMLVVWPSSLPAPASATPPAGSYDAATAQHFVAAYTARHGLPGAAYVVVKDGTPVASGGVGDLDRTTPLAVGSVAKSFTAFAVLQLAERGRVALDAPVTDYLPSFAIGGTDSAAITVRMLLDHTSGMPNPLLVTPTGNLEGDVAGIENLHVTSTPGEAYGYSNLNYRTLAYLVQVVSGQPFDTYLHDHIFRPLGMDSTTSVLTVNSRPGLDNGHVTAWGLALPIPELRAGVGGAGGVISTAEDMGAWLAMQQRGGVTATGARLLSTELVDQSHTTQPNAGTYGLGWQHTSTAEPPRIGHDGSLTRYSAREDLVPSSGYAVAVLLNSYTPTYQHPFSISTGLIDISEGRQPTPGVPVATIIDLVLAVVTIAVGLLGARGWRRSGRWVEIRAHHPRWRRLLRLVPQLIMPAVAVVLFFGLTLGPGNPATPVDAFGLWPAAATLVAVAALTGIMITSTRVRAQRRVAMLR